MSLTQEKVDRLRAALHKSIDGMREFRLDDALGSPEHLLNCPEIDGTVLYHVANSAHELLHTLDVQLATAARVTGLTAGWHPNTYARIPIPARLGTAAIFGLAAPASPVDSGIETIDRDIA